MSVAHSATPLAVRVMPRPEIRQQISAAVQDATFRIEMLQRTAEIAAQAVQWIDNEMLMHVLVCAECRWRACRSLRAMRRASARADRSYQRAIKRLVGGQP